MLEGFFDQIQLIFRKGASSFLRRLGDAVSDGKPRLTDEEIEELLYWLHSIGVPAAMIEEVRNALQAYAHSPNGSRSFDWVNMTLPNCTGYDPIPTPSAENETQPTTIIQCTGEETHPVAISNVDDESDFFNLFWVFGAMLIGIILGIPL